LTRWSTTCFAQMPPSTPLLISSFAVSFIRAFISVVIGAYRTPVANCLQLSNCLFCVVPDQSYVVQIVFQQLQNHRHNSSTKICIELRYVSDIMRGSCKIALDAQWAPAIGVEFEVARASTSRRKRCADKHSGCGRRYWGKSMHPHCRHFPMILHFLPNTVSWQQPS
jgi:hypothetical protein